MQLKETINDGLKRGYELRILASDLDAKIIKKIEESRADFQMKGFRKGQAPVALIKKLHGKALLGEAMQESLDLVMKDHFEKSGDKPAMQPDVQMVNKDWKEGEDIDLTMTYEALPKIPKTDFSKIKLEKLLVEPDKKVVTETLNNLASSSGNYREKKKGLKAENADQLVIDFVGKVDGEKFEGGSAEDYPLVLGSNSFIPGFEEQLIGVKKAQKLDVKVTFPEKYTNKALAAKNAVFSVTVKSINEAVPATVNDELAQKLGAKDLSELKVQIKNRLESEYNMASRTVLKRQLMDKLDKIVKFKLPNTLVDNEAKGIAQQLWHEENPEAKKNDENEILPTKEHRAIAERRVKLGLFFAELGNENKISVTDSELQNAIMERARQYPGQEKAFFDFIKKSPETQEQIRAPIFEDKVVDFIVELAAVKEKSVSKEALKKAVESLEDS